ncbi:hypothetical protein Tcan_02436 [Toxocara canis]|nr:hypothetical protein Tcan_02436 [Toxocara canis]
MKEKKAFTFHDHVFKVGHEIEGLQEWLRVPENFNEATVFRELQYGRMEWEPQFVATQSIPMHDESFPFRRRSHTHLSVILCRLGYTFTIVNDLFSVHNGFKRQITEYEIRLLRMTMNSYKKVFRFFFFFNYPKQTLILTYFRRSCLAPFCLHFFNIPIHDSRCQIFHLNCQ